jgi:protease-4
MSDSDDGAGGAAERGADGPTGDGSAEAGGGDAGWGREVYILFVALGLVVGLGVAPLALSASPAEEPAGTVAVVPVAGQINGPNVAVTSAALERAREDPNVEAVVVVFNSGGGGAASSEELYLQTRRTAAEMPVVGSIDATAASGAYYTAAATDYIYAKPASLVGSVGVVASLPRKVEPNQQTATTGPNKLAGADTRDFLYIIDSAQSAFLSAVLDQRGDTLALSRAELAQARLYSGAQATENGLVDAIGDRRAAVDRAARMAGLEEYRVEVIRPNTTVQFVSRANYAAADVPDKRMVSAGTVLGEGSAPRMLMMPESYVADALANRSVVGGAEAASATGPTAGNDTGVADGAN